MRQETEGIDFKTLTSVNCQEWREWGCIVRFSKDMDWMPPRRFSNCPVAITGSRTEFENTKPNIRLYPDSYL